MPAAGGTRHVRDPYTDRPKTRSKMVKTNKKADAALAALAGYNQQMADDPDSLFGPDVLADVRAQGVDVDEVEGPAPLEAPIGIVPGGAAPLSGGDSDASSASSSSIPNAPGAKSGGRFSFRTNTPDQDFRAADIEATKAQTAADKAEATAAQRAKERTLEAVGQGAQVVSYHATTFRDTLANLPTPGGIGALIAIQLLLVLFLLPVNGLPRIAWLWLVFTRQASLAGTSVGGGTAGIGSSQDPGADIGGAVGSAIGGSILPGIGGGIGGDIGSAVGSWVEGLSSTAQNAASTLNLYEQQGGDLLQNLGRYTGITGFTEL